MSDPLLFISHKHSGSTIAQVLAAFIEERSGVIVQGATPYGDRGKHAGHCSLERFWTLL
jgi:hypothetical protein